METVDVAAQSAPISARPPGQGFGQRWRARKEVIVRYRTNYAGPGDQDPTPLPRRCRPTPAWSCSRACLQCGDEGAFAQRTQRGSYLTLGQYLTSKIGGPVNMPSRAGGDLRRDRPCFSPRLLLETTRRDCRGRSRIRTPSQLLRMPTRDRPRAHGRGVRNPVNLHTAHTPSARSLSLVSRSPHPQILRSRHISTYLGETPEGGDVKKSRSWKSARVCGHAITLTPLHRPSAHVPRATGSLRSLHPNQWG